VPCAHAAGNGSHEDDAAIMIRPQALQTEPRPQPAQSQGCGSRQPLGDAVRVVKSEITTRGRLPQSNMPTGIVNVLKREELLDLLAYLMSDQPANAAVGK
jgi:hypothetical protein